MLNEQVVELLSVGVLNRASYDTTHEISIRKSTSEMYERLTHTLFPSLQTPADSK
uniref:Uncharacterized protein n=1 Tax=Utricularia reniformis TaxID=192314 RepID=A0A1Y0B1H0_9LAMI|nr:hypothetical protein AEK19_MT0988 [Utricularia reniformis]ART31213.1 hypothetical protein AEK19_MT0988 [Utricularia reniformis]